MSPMIFGLNTHLFEYLEMIRKQNQVTVRYPKHRNFPGENFGCRLVAGDRSPGARPPSPSPFGHNVNVMTFLRQKNIE